jgi:glycosyltransferase involved in cell wall biosynthesis
VGAYFQIPAWVARPRFERVVLINNILNQDHLSYALATLRQLGYEAVEIVTTSRALRNHLEAQGLHTVDIQPSWIDISRFSPSGPHPDRAFTVGRLSRDVPEKFHQTDPQLFGELAKRKLTVRLMGATCLQPLDGVEILPEGGEDAAKFLRSLDALIYRTADGWFEAFGRVVFEGMACGVVPVVHRQGGYAGFIEDKVEGFLWDEPAQAVEHLETLRSSPSLLAQISQAARRKTELLYGQEARQALVDFYFGR